MYIVLDTNVLVSSLWTPAGNASAIVDLIPQKKIIPLYNSAIMDEYQDVLFRPKFSFPGNDVNRLIEMLTRRGLSVEADTSTIPFVDEADRKFYCLAKTYNAFLVTGNTKHFPQESLIVTPRDFLKLW
jgi:putative PIN family toxin of toxin-antitoxin system